MFTFASWPLQWARSFGHRFFLQFGLHCATHQIRVILISCVVITSLFYPALDVYTSSRTSSQSIVDTFRSPRSIPLPAEYDLVDLWSGYDTLRVHKDPVTRAKCNNGHALRVERILIQSQLVEDDGALNYKILLSTYDLEHRIHQLISASDSPCLKKLDGQCIVISPLAFWNYDKDAMGLDANILDTLGYSKNVSIAGIPVTPHMVLAGRGSYEPRVGGANKFDYATYLVLTYFFPRNACWGSGSEHTHWIQVVRDAVGQSGEVDVHVPEATLIALEYVPDRASSAQGQSVISAFLYLAYIGFFAYVVWTVRHMDAIHSRLGITFTALVEIAVSTITSLSVCALVGFKITMVPWEVLPIVIVFVGAENMFNLVDAVGKTSVTLSVKQRIAEGLSRAGTSNTLKVVSYNAILGVIAFFSVGAVRQFCAFAIVVLVAHWFLAHTLFIAVLSIDIARLELEELLRHDTSLAPSVPSLIQNQKETQNSKKPRSGWQKLIMTIKHLLKGRAATNISLLMLLAIAGTLYYTTYTTSTSLPPPSVSSLQRLGAVARSKKAASKPWSGATAHSSAVPAEQVWKTLNTVQTSLLHLRIEHPVTVTFNPRVESSSASSITTTRSRYTMRTSSIVFWLLTIMVVPIAATTGALYGLLLYLLRNTELLEAQRNRLGADDEDDTTVSAFAKNSNGKVKGKKSLDGEVEFSTLPRVFSSDVELVESSKDGRVVVCVGLHNEVVVWDVDNGECIAKTDAADLFLRTVGAGLANGLSLGMTAGPSSSALPNITCVTVDDEGKHLAVGTSSGLFIACSVDRDIGNKHGVASLRPLALMGPENLTSGVLELRFVESRRKIGRNLPPNGFGSESNSPESKLMKSKVKEDAKTVRLLATYKDGTATKWTIPTNSASKHFLNTTYFTPSRHSAVIRVLLLPVLSGNRTLIGFCLDDGTLELIEGENDRTLSKTCVLQGGNPYDLVWKAHACQTEMGGRTRLVVVTATEVGVISLWDGFTGECISILEEGAPGKVNQLRISPVQCETCHFCGQLPMESLSVAFSVDHVVKFEKLYIDDTNLATAQSSRRCSCSKASAHLLQQKVQGLSRMSSTERILVGKRSRSNSSAASTQGSSPLIPRARLATAFESSSSLSTASSFPVSGHGVHSRRASEKEGMPRRSSELVAVPPFPSRSIVGNAGEYNVASNGDVSSGTAIGTPSAYSIWKNATVAPLMAVTSERGGWDASGNVYMGIRRKSRSQCQSKNVVSSLSNGSDEGLTKPTLERWEFWIFDPATTTMRFSSLISLVPESTKAMKSSSSTSQSESPSSRKTSCASSRTPFLYTFPSNTSGVPTARLPFTRVSPMRITSSHVLAGFGNTIGIFKFTSS